MLHKKNTNKNISVYNIYNKLFIKGKNENTKVAIIKIAFNLPYFIFTFNKLFSIFLHPNNITTSFEKNQVNFTKYKKIFEGLV